jgi:uracil-DNA glycosylase
MRPLLLGESPSPGGDPTLPFGGRIADRLSSVMGWEYDPYDEYPTPYDRLRYYFDTLNVIEQAEDADPWSNAFASRRWTRWLKGQARLRAVPTVVVACGRRAARAIGAGDRDYYEWPSSWTGQLYESVVIPHPSGRNRLWNDPVTGERVRVALSEALRRAAG